MKPLLYLLLATLLIGYASLSCIGGSTKHDMDILVPYWTRSYELYHQPHALWLDRYEAVGDNLPKLKYVLEKATQARRTPEVVVYAIPLRDLGQSSEGGFANYELYWQDNVLNAREIQRFVDSTGLRPRVYIEPDSIPLAVQYRRDENFSDESVQIYKDRMSIMHRLLDLYNGAGARVYLEAGHSGWFDYGDADIQRIADALNDAGIAKAHGLASNVSNRQSPYHAPNDEGRNEWHYFSRLLPKLVSKNLDVAVDTSRSGGTTHARIYYLHPNGQLIDNETPSGRLVGSWRVMKRKRPVTGETFQDVLLEPFFQDESVKPQLRQKWMSRLTTKEKYTYNAEKRLLQAPAWLDPVGDVKLGPPPTDDPPGLVSELIDRYRYIKPPDECDGALNCPPGQSKHDIWAETAKRQPAGGLGLSAAVW